MYKEMKYSGYRKHLMTGGKDNADTNSYDAGYDQGQKDLFVPMCVVGIVCGVLGYLIAL